MTLRPISMMNFVILKIFFLLKSLLTILTIGIKMTECGQYSAGKFPVTEPVADNDMPIIPGADMKCLREIS